MNNLFTRLNFYFFSPHRPKSDIVRNAKTISMLAIEIVGDTTKTKDDVSSSYHRIVQNFQWSESEDNGSGDDGDSEEASDVASGDEDDNDGEPKTPQKSTRRGRKNTVSPNLNPKKWKHDCNELLNEMVTLPMSQPFREPVSGIEFPDYHRFISTPMDLSTVRESLQVGDYSSPLDFQKDVRLIFHNSKEYNTNPKSKVLGMTHKLEDWFEKRIGTLVHDWKMTVRRLKYAKQKHKAKKQDQSPLPDYKGKGKGKGKGQSNRIKKKMADSSDDEDDQDDADYSANVKLNPQAGPSTTTRSSPKKKVVSTAAPPLRNAMTEANAGRRTSSRQISKPLRFQDEADSEEEAEEEESPKKVTKTAKDPTQMPSTSSGIVANDDVKDEFDDDEEEIPLAKRANNKRKVSPMGKSNYWI